MLQNRQSFAALSSFVLATFAAVAINSVADAACNSGTYGYTNTCYGSDVGVSITSATYSTAVGYSALRSTTSGSGNTAIGYWALRTNNIGYLNTATGNSALRSNTSGYENTAHGNGALSSNSYGYKNTANGSLALFSNNTGTHNTATGAEALRYTTNGIENTATGYRALYADTSGWANTAVGAKALNSNNTGSFNTAVGSEALFTMTTGFRNVGLGWRAGEGNPTGSDNIYIGAYLLGAYGENGLIRIGSKNYQKKTFIAGIRGVPTGQTGAVAVLIDANGQLGTINSSRRFKEDIQPMGSVSERLFALRPVTFRYKQAYEDGSKPVQYGLVAEEVAEVFPELVVYGKDGKPETVAYHVLATLLLNELQKDHRVMQAQSEELAALRAEVAMLAKLVQGSDKDRMVASTR